MEHEKPRTKHHHSNLKETLISYAIQAAQSQTLDDLSIRKASREIGVSPGAAYRHFANKDALMRTVADRGFDQLALAFEDALPFESAASDKSAARARFVSLARAYVAFAHENYGLWRLMFGPFGLAPVKAKDRPSTYDWLGKSLVEMAQFGLIAPPTAQAQFFVWSAIHGLSDLKASPAISVQPGQTPIEVQCDYLIAALNLARPD